MGLKISDRSDYPPLVAKAYMWLTKTKTETKHTCGCCYCFQGPPPCWGSSRTRQTFPSRHFSTSVSRGTSPRTANSFVKLGMIWKDNLHLSSISWKLHNQHIFISILILKFLLIIINFNIIPTTTIIITTMLFSTALAMCFHLLPSLFSIHMRPGGNRIMHNLKKNYFSNSVSGSEYAEVMLFFTSDQHKHSLIFLSHGELWGWKNILFGFYFHPAVPFCVN